MTGQVGGTRLSASVLLGALALAGCSGDDEQPEQLEAGPSPTATTADPDAAASPRPGDVSATSTPPPVVQEPVPPGLSIEDDVPGPAQWSMLADWPELDQYPSSRLVSEAGQI